MDDITINKLLDELPKHMDDPDYLSRAVVDLARLGYRENVLLAEAELKERQAFLNAKQGEEKMTVGEAEADSVIVTGNDYGLKKLNRESLDGVINAAKLRIRVLIGEKESSKME